MTCASRKAKLKKIDEAVVLNYSFIAKEVVLEQAFLDKLLFVHLSSHQRPGNLLAGYNVLAVLTTFIVY